VRKGTADSRRFANQERGHIVHKPLVQVVAGDDDNDIGFRLIQLFSHQQKVVIRGANAGFAIRIFAKLPRQKWIVSDANRFYKFRHTTVPAPAGS
jgi:hypothetical protein